MARKPMQFDPLDLREEEDRVQRFPPMDLRQTEFEPLDLRADEDKVQKFAALDLRPEPERVQKFEPMDLRPEADRVQRFPPMDLREDPEMAKTNAGIVRAGRDQIHKPQQYQIDSAVSAIKRSLEQSGKPKPKPPPGEVEDPMLRGVVAGVGSAADRAAGGPSVGALAGGSIGEQIKQKSPLVAAKLGLDSGTGGSGPVDPDADLKAAQSQARRDAGWAELQEGGATIGRAGLKQGPDKAYWKGQIEGAERPVQDLMALRGEAEKRRKAGRETEEDRRNAEKLEFERKRLGMDEQKAGREQSEYEEKKARRDPNHPISKRARAEAVAVHPEIVKKIPPEVFEQYTLEDVERLYKEVNQQKDRATAARVARGEQLDQQKYGKDVAEREMLDSALAILEEAVNNPKKGLFGDDIAGAGRLDSTLPDEMVDKKDLKVRQAAKQAASSYVAIISGKAASDKEREFIMKTYGLQEGGSQEGFREGVRRMVVDAERAKAGLDAKYHPEVVARYKTARAQGEQNRNVAPAVPGGGDNKITPSGKPFAKKQYSAQRNQTRFVDAQGNEIEVVNGRQ